MPENLTRREFLKDLGLMGAGVTLAPVAAQGETLDAFMQRAEESWKPGPFQRPVWVREVDTPTTEIDWDKMERFDERNTAFNSAKYLTEERQKKLAQIQQENLGRWLNENRPGYTLKDQVLYETFSARSRASAAAGEFPFLGPRTVKTPQERGVPKFTASPEEAAKVVTTAARFFGAATIGFVEINPKTTQKLIFSYDADGKKLEFADVEMADETKEKRIIPNKCRYAIVFTVQMSRDIFRRAAPTTLVESVSMYGYELGGLVKARIQEFLRGLGYQCLGGYSHNALGIAPALGVMAGLGELSRYNRLITPEYGPMVRVFRLLTDLPVAPTKPINAGLLEFCRRCKKCAEACPSKAISFADEPTWQVVGEFNNPGHKAWFEDAVKCRSYWSEAGSDCGICFAVCPFSSKDKAFMHTFRDWLAGTTPAFDGMLRSLDDALYGTADASGKAKDPGGVWQLDLPEFGIDSTRGHRDV